MENHNELLGEFLGRRGKTNKHLFAFKDIQEGDKVWFTTSELKFNSDWNWLMEVVEKINTMDEWRFSLHIYFCRVTIYDNLNKEWILEDFQKEDDTLATVYNACVKFIKWYNQQKVKK